MAMSCNCTGGPNCCRYGSIRFELSDHTEPMPPIPLEWWRQVSASPYTLPVVPDWWYADNEGHWMLDEQGQWKKVDAAVKPAPAYNDDMRC